MNQKYLHMANDIKSQVKTGSPEIFIQFENGLVSSEEFKGYEHVINAEDVLQNVYVKNNWDIDNQKGIDRLAKCLQLMDSIMQRLK